MPENNLFEKLMQDKLNRLQLEPVPADWQAIYERLHPRKKRDFIWWWIPLFLGLAAGSIWMINKRQTPVSQKTGIPLTSTVKTLSPETIDSLTQIPGRDNQPGFAGTDAKQSNKRSIKDNQVFAKHNNQVIEKHINPVITEHKSQVTAERSNQVITKHINLVTAEQNNQVIKNHNNQVIAKHNHGQGNKAPLEPYSKEKLTEYGPDPLNISPLVIPAEPSKNTQEIINPAQVYDSVTVKKSSDINQVDNHAVDSVSPALQKITPEHWRWAGYVGTGPAFTNGPIGNYKSAMADLSAANPGSSYTYAKTSQKNGWHFTAGIMTEHNWRRNWIFSVGAGINTSNWKSGTDVYKDSIMPGTGSANAPSMAISSFENSYRIWMTEFPLQVSNRIAGKKAGSFWWTIGINNQFLLSLSRKTASKAAIQNPPARSDKKSLTSEARFYQPQLRLGLVYNHSGKDLHWQLQPLFQYTLPGVYNSNNADDIHLTNLQFQFRIFFREKKSQ